MTEEQFRKIALRCQEHLRRNIKINVAPWMKGRMAAMDDLYTDLTMEKKSGSKSGYSKPVKDYTELFTKTGARLVDDVVSSETVLAKGDAGMGKTTLAKRIAFDWSKGKFNNFSLVFFLQLKFARPGDSLEKVIAQQNKWLQHMVVDGLSAGEDVISALLETFGEKCLLILDGLDECVDGSNADVMELIQGNKLSNCNVLLTSRPHVIKDVLSCHFDTMAQVEGFSQKQAKKFASKLLDDPSKVKAVLAFNRSSAREHQPLHKCPILLSFLCILVNEETDLDLSQPRISVGEIYSRMIRCLYKKYKLRLEESAEQAAPDKFLDVFKRLGKLALETLLSGHTEFLKVVVLENVGQNAFDIGLLVGDEDFGETTKDFDIVVTWAHRTIQEFLASYHFVRMLTEGHCVRDSLLSKDFGLNPVFLTNPLFLKFSLWFLDTESCSEYFQTDARLGARNTLVSFTADLLRTIYAVSSGDGGEPFTLKALAEHNKFCFDVVSSWAPQHLVLPDDSMFPILEAAMKLTTLKTVSFGFHLLPSQLLSHGYESDALLVNLAKLASTQQNMQLVNRLIDKGHRAGRRLNIHFVSWWFKDERSENQALNMKQVKRLHVCPDGVTLKALLKSAESSELTHLSLDMLSNTDLPKSWLPRVNCLRHLTKLSLAHFCLDQPFLASFCALLWAELSGLRFACDDKKSRHDIDSLMAILHVGKPFEDKNFPKLTTVRLSHSTQDSDTENCVVKEWIMRRENLFEPQDVTQDRQESDTSGQWGGRQSLDIRGTDQQASADEVRSGQTSQVERLSLHFTQVQQALATPWPNLKIVCVEGKWDEAIRALADVLEQDTTRRSLPKVKYLDLLTLPKSSGCQGPLREKGVEDAVLQLKKRNITLCTRFVTGRMLKMWKRVPETESVLDFFAT